jgi:hypothetical protein
MVPTFVNDKIDQICHNPDDAEDTVKQSCRIQQEKSEENHSIAHEKDAVFLLPHGTVFRIAVVLVEKAVKAEPAVVKKEKTAEAVKIIENGGAHGSAAFLFHRLSLA